MKKSCRILLYKILLIILVSIYVYFITTNKIYFNNHNYDDTEFKLKILNINIDGDSATIELKGKSKLLGRIYFKSIKDRIDFNKKYQIGDYVKVSGNLAIPAENRVFNLFNYRKYLLSKKIYYILNIDKIEKINESTNFLYKLKNNINKKLLEINNPYVTIYVNSNNDFDSEIYNNYQINGVSHLLAASGMHVSVFVISINKLLNKFCLRKNHIVMVTILFLLLFLFITSFKTSLLRAVVFYILLIIKKKFNIKIENHDLLLFLCIILLLINPYYIYDLGFIFSFKISFYLIFFKNLFQTNSYIITSLIISLTAFLASIPILIINFFEVNFISILANIIFVPFFSYIVFPLSLITFIFNFLTPILTIVTNVAELITEYLSSFKIFNIILPTFGVLTVLIYDFIIFALLKSKFKIKWIVILISLIFMNANYKYINQKYYITMIDVSQGESILLELPNNINILVDTGGIFNYKESWARRRNEYSLARGTLIPYLKSIGIKKLDYLIITHGDFDHAGETINLIKNFKVETVIFNSADINNLEKNIIDVLDILKIEYLFLNKNIMKLKDAQLNFINKQNKNNENEDSLIFHLKILNYNLLFTGDAGFESENYILDEYFLPEMDILKVGHHGSKFSTSDRLLDQLNPKIALISSGINNRFNHPSDEVINKLTKRSIVTYNTSKHGSIRIKLDQSIKIKTIFD